MRHPLTRALASAGLTAHDVATQLQVDPKTVDRWFAGRVPYPRHRNELSRLTGWTIADLWPDTIEREPKPAADEVRATYANRSLVPADTWRSLFRNAEQAIDIIAYSALFLLEDPTVLRTLSERAAAGVPIRIALGEVDGRQVERRGTDERIGELISARIGNAFVLVEPLLRDSKVQLRVHDSVLYDSIYRCDDDVIVNSHIYGIPAAHAPTMHLRRQEGGTLAVSYLAAIEHIWGQAKPTSGRSGFGSGFR